MSRQRFRIDRRMVAFGGAASLVALAARAGRAATLDKVTFQTNWRAQAEHGGFYFAQAEGLYEKYGIICDLRQGGPLQNPSQLLLGGRVDMIMSNALEALHYVREGLPFVCIAAIFQKDPTVIISHAGVGHDSLPALKGKPILIGAEARNSFWPFLRARFGFTDTQARPYTFNMAPFLADRMVSQQGFLSSEPYAIAKVGVTPVVHLLADAGFSNYHTTVHVARAMAAQKADLVQRFITATLEGWAGYLRRGTAGARADALIRRDNPEMDDDKIAYAVEVMSANGIVRSGHATTLGIGAMTAQRWNSFYDAMTSAGVLPAGLDVGRAYDLRFVNQGIGV